MIRWWVCCCLLFGFGASANSTVIKVTVEGNQVHWHNAISIGGDRWVPSFWQHINHVTPTSSWLPGSWAMLPPSSITLSSGAQNAVIPMVIDGLEYNTASVTPVAGRTSDLSVCGINTHTANIIQLIGQQCYLNNWLDMPSAITPFSFSRPVFELSEQELLEGLKGKGAGVYFGVVQLTSVYRYDLNGYETQRYINHSVALEVDYHPSAIYSAQVTGDYRLLPIYDFNQGTVSANTQLRVDVTGYFSQGIRLSLAENKLDYQLKGPSLSQIPYSISCPQCEESRFVEHGAIYNSQTVVGRSSTTQIQFDIRVHFESQDLDPIESGEYYDTFTLLLEPEV